MAMTGLTATWVKSALAEFQIQEAGIEKGEVELEYRGAYHWGVPEATEDKGNANDLIQSHPGRVLHDIATGHAFGVQGVGKRRGTTN